MDELLGDHNTVVDRLEDRLKALRDGTDRVATMVVLRGSIGVGKSLIIREFYARLREGQQEPGYWPLLQNDKPRAVRLGVD